MASPAPEAAVQAAPPAETKPVEGVPVPSKPITSELNGHSASHEPTSEPTANSEKPALNGLGNDAQPAPTNGVPKEPTPSAADSTTAAPTENAPATTADATAEPAAEPPKDAPQVAKAPEDVEMTDAAPTKPEAPPSPAKQEPAPAAEPVSTSDATQNDVTQPEVKESETKESAAPVSVAPETTPAPAEEPEKPVEAPTSTEETAPTTGSSAPPPTSQVDLQPASLSQLAIESTDDTSPVETSIEVSMTEAPGAKVPREREDDVEGADGPAPKRAKTEPKEDEPSAEGAAPVSEQTPASVATPASAAPSEQPAVLATGASLNLDDLPKWNDSEFAAKTIQPFQLRDMRKSMARVKKTKNGYHFRDSVQKLWPGLWDKYSTSVEKPIDLGEIDRNLRDGKYKTFNDVRVDLRLVAENSRTFNGPDHTMTVAALTAVKSAWEDILNIPDEEPVKQKPPPKQNRVREPRSATVKPEITALAGTPQAAQSAAAEGDASAAKPAAAAPAAAGSTPRRAPTADVDRPKRTVRAPKPKDIDYTTKPSRKKLKPELQFCDDVLSELMSNKHSHLNRWFNDPVDAEGLGIPHYYSVITNPMDLGKIQRMLHGGEIASLKDFEKNVQLVFTNCYKFNGEPDPTNVSGLAKQLEDIYTAQMKGKDAWLAKHAKANPPPSASVGSDDDEEDEDDDEGADDGVAAGPDPTGEVKDLEVRLREEMDKQADLFAAEQPNQSMIQIQQGIVNMVQQALLQAKQKLNEYKLAKNSSGAGAGKPKKAKATKAKAAGGAGGRKSGGAAGPAKKASGGGGQKKKKNLTATDKDNIANAINDLENAHLDKAIDIIKRDTGQMESEDGELELDIDQLSHEALLKLWELCKKVLPGFGKDPNAAAETSRGGQSKQPKTAAKPKKNKPMSAQEQEARIAQLREIRDLYKPGQEPADEADATHEAMAAAMDDSSDDSSEEE